MKIRKGFVSNSSTSSFIVAGYRVEKDNKLWEKIKQKLYPNGVSKDTPEWDIRYEIKEYIEQKYGVIYVNDWENVRFDCEEDEEIVGAVISDGDLSEIDNKEITVETLRSKTEKIRDLYKVKGEPSLFIGLRSC
jgi:hypothetical protein